MRHLSDEELARLAAGELGFLSRSMAAKHLEHCASCSERLKSYQSDNILVAEVKAARAHRPQEGGGEETLRKLKRKLDGGD